MTPATLQDHLRAATATLAAAGVDDPAVDARYLMAHALGLAPHALTLELARLLNPDESASFTTLITARASRRPVAKIIGKRAFWNYDFIVTDATLDPRPDTETLVAEALRAPFAKMLDLGTGTGCILLSCLAERPMAHGTGTDVSAAALQVAAANATAMGLTARASFVQSDWFSAIDGRFDLIVSNPPYIAADEMAALAPEVRNHDPHLALTPGGDGLDPYRRIAAGAGARLLSGGRILLEIGPTQAPEVTAMLDRAGFCQITTLIDIDGRNRVIAAQKP
jgi:release factor glutamine methyltransferase